MVAVMSVSKPHLLAALLSGLVATFAVAQDPQVPPAPPPGEVPPEVPSDPPPPSPLPPGDVRDIVTLTPTMKAELVRLQRKFAVWAQQEQVVRAALDARDRRTPAIPEAKWRTLDSRDPQVRPYLDSDTARHLQSRVSSSEGACAFAVLRDAQGRPAAATIKPMRYDDGAEERFTTPRHRREAWMGGPEKDVVAKRYWVSISVPVLDFAARDGRPVPEAERRVLGTLEVGVDLRHLARLVIDER